jgi:uncharacterized membrane protein YfcA
MSASARRGEPRIARAAAPSERRARVCYEAAVADGTTTPDRAAPRLRYWTPGFAVFAIAWLAACAIGFDDPLGAARAHGFLVLVGFAVAVVANATAIGGGIFFIPILVFGYGLSPLLAVKLSIAGQAFGMTSGAIAWLRRGVVPRAALRAAVPPVLIGATASALLFHPSASLVKGVFGPVSIALGALALWLLDPPAERDEPPAAALLPLRAIAFAGGCVSGWVAIGAGELAAAFLMLVHHVRADRAIGLGVVLLSAASLWLLAIHGFLLDGIPWDMAAFLVLGTVFGARLGPFLAQYVAPRKLKLLFGVVAIADGVLFAVQAFLR